MASTQRVWVRLHVEDEDPVEGSVQVIVNGIVDDLRDAVKLKMAVQLAHCDASQLKVYLGGNLLDIGDALPAGNSRQNPLIIKAHSRTQEGAVQSADTYSLDKALISRISSSVLCLTSDKDVSSTALVWDYVDENVLILTNYHTWAIPEFKDMFPPKKKSNKKRKADDENVINFRLQNDSVDQSFSLTPEMVLCYDEQQDYAVLTLPKIGFTTKRIPISLEVGKTLKIHTFGYVGHTNTLNITDGVVCSIIPHGFTMNLLSAPNYSGAAVIFDGYGRAVGYMGGNYDASEKKNSQHQSHGFKFDAVAAATNRDPNSPTTSPTGKRTN